MLFPKPLEEVPFLTSAEMVEVDRAMMEDYRIGLIQMMENAGRCLAHLARVRFLAGDPRGKKVLVLAGTGGNGGGALVSARRLFNYGADVRVMLTKPGENLTPVPAHQLDILNKMQVPTGESESFGEVREVDLILDGLIGYSLQGNPSGTAGELIRWANAQTAPILSLDVPSGVDTTTGKVYEPAIQAAATLTLALPKEGLRAPGVRDHVGELYLADISVPPQLYAGPGLNRQVGPLFTRSDILRIW